jgi:hypothetical protein
MSLEAQKVGNSLLIVYAPLTSIFNLFVYALLIVYDSRSQFSIYLFMHH